MDAEPTAREMLEATAKRLAQRLADADVSKMRPSTVARMLGQVARAVRDLEGKDAPPPTAERGEAITLLRETPEEWNARMGPRQ